jgi:hypothetical protein
VSRMVGAIPRLAFLLMLLSSAGSATAATVYFKAGDDLKRSCEGTAAGEENASTAEYLLCLGYLQAVVDTDVTFAEWGEHPRHACIPPAVTSSQLRQVFLGWLDARPPDYLTFGAASLVLTALSESWPCKTE